MPVVNHRGALNGKTLPVLGGSAGAQLTVSPLEGLNEQEICIRPKGVSAAKVTPKLISGVDPFELALNYHPQ